MNVVVYEDNNVTKLSRTRLTLCSSSKDALSLDFKRSGTTT